MISDEIKRFVFIFLPFRFDGCISLGSRSDLDVSVTTIDVLNMA